MQNACVDNVTISIYHYRARLKLETFKHLNMKCQEHCISLIQEQYTLRISTMMDKGQVCYFA